jgi:hypothetical protein
MRHCRSFCHIINYVTLQLYDNFPVSQTHHIKEVKQYMLFFQKDVDLYQNTLGPLGVSQYPHQ